MYFLQSMQFIFFKLKPILIYVDIRFSKQSKKRAKKSQTKKEKSQSAVTVHVNLHYFYQL